MKRTTAGNGKRGRLEKVIPGRPGRSTSAWRAILRRTGTWRGGIPYKRRVSPGTERGSTTRDCSTASSPSRCSVNVALWLPPCFPTRGMTKRNDTSARSSSCGPRPAGKLRSLHLRRPPLRLQALKTPSSSTRHPYRTITDAFLCAPTHRGKPPRRVIPWRSCEACPTLFHLRRTDRGAPRGGIHQGPSSKEGGPEIWEV